MFYFVSFILFQLRLHTRQQDRVPRITESNGRRVSRTSNHQLGRDLMGEKTFGTVGRSGDPGDSVSYGSAATRLSRLQGTHPFVYRSFRM